MASPGFVSVNVKADQQYVQRLKIVAAKRGQTMADMLRAALDAQYGEELQAAIPLANSGTRKRRS